jgi:hypothetical protein
MPWGSRTKRLRRLGLFSARGGVKPDIGVMAIGSKETRPVLSGNAASSNTQPPLAPEIPIDGTPRRHGARDMLAEFLLEGGPPWH